MYVGKLMHCPRPTLAFDSSKVGGGGGGGGRGAMVLGKLPVPGRHTIWIKVGQGLTALAVGAGGAW